MNAITSEMKLFLHCGPWSRSQFSLDPSLKTEPERKAKAFNPPVQNDYRENEISEH